MLLEMEEKKSVNSIVQILQLILTSQDVPRYSGGHWQISTLEAVYWPNEFGLAIWSTTELNLYRQKTVQNYIYFIKLN